MAKVIETMRSTGTPISGTRTLSHEIARMAIPTRVWRTRMSRPIIAAAETRIVTSWIAEKATPPQTIVVDGISWGSIRGEGPIALIAIARFSSRRPMASAVMTSDIRGARRSGR